MPGPSIWPSGLGRESADPRRQDSEFVAHAGGGVDVRRGQIAAGHAVVHAAVHGAEVSVEVLVEVVVSVEGKGLEAAAANAVRGSRAAGLLAGAVGVLIVAVVGHGQI